MEKHSNKQIHDLMEPVSSLNLEFTPQEDERAQREKERKKGRWEQKNSDIINEEFLNNDMSCMYFLRKTNRMFCLLCSNHLRHFVHNATCTPLLPCGK